MSQPPIPRRNPVTAPYEHANRHLQIVSKCKRRLHLTLMIYALVFASFGFYAIHRSAVHNEELQGALEADAAIADARRAMTLWTPEQGYAPMMGHTFLAVSSWGATEVVRALDQGAGISIDYAFSSQSQCQALIINAASFFDTLMVDGLSARDSNGAPDPAPCSKLGQNAMRLSKLDRRVDDASLSAGLNDNQRGGVIAQRAIKPPSSGSSPTPPPTR